MEQIFYDFASRIKKNFIPTSRRISRQDIPRSLCSEVIHLLTHVYLDFWSVISPVQKNATHFLRDFMLQFIHTFQIHFENETIIGLSILVGTFRSRVDSN